MKEQMPDPANRPKIAYVIQNAGMDLASDVGAPILVKYTVNGLQKAGYQSSLLTLNGRSVIGIDDASKLNAQWYASLGLTGTRLFLFLESGLRRLQGELRLPYFALFDTYRFYEACYRSLPNYTICHEYHGLFSLGAALACFRRKTPYILTVDADLLLEFAVIGKPLKGLHALVATWVAKLNYKLANKIICVSKPAKQHFVRNWGVNPEKIVVIPNGVDIELFGRYHASDAVRNQLGVGHDPTVMFVGGFQPWHGLDRLVECFALVLSELPNTKLLLVGDGPARSVLEQKCSELDITNSVIITGLVPHDQIPEMLAAADVVVALYPRLPKEMWFSPLKLYEYMAAGKAIVASKGGQIVEVVQDNHNGLLVEVGNIADFAQAITALLKNPAERKRLGKNAQQQAIEQHSWEQSIRRLEEIYLSVL